MHYVGASLEGSFLIFLSGLSLSGGSLVEFSRFNGMEYLVWWVLERVLGDLVRFYDMWTTGYHVRW